LERCAAQAVLLCLQAQGGAGQAKNACEVLGGHRDEKGEWCPGLIEGWQTLLALNPKEWLRLPAWDFVSNVMRIVREVRPEQFDPETAWKRIAERLRVVDVPENVCEFSRELRNHRDRLAGKVEHLPAVADDPTAAAVNPNEQGKGYRGAPKLATALALLQCHPTWSVKQIAHAAHCSPNYLSQRDEFKSVRKVVKEIGRQEMPRGSKSKRGEMEAESLG
jgi:hypothetical protein